MNARPREYRSRFYVRLSVEEEYRTEYGSHVCDQIDSFDLKEFDNLTAAKEFRNDLYLKCTGQEICKSCGAIYPDAEYVCRRCGKERKKA